MERVELVVETKMVLILQHLVKQRSNLIIDLWWRTSRVGVDPIRSLWRWPRFKNFSSGFCKKKPSDCCGATWICITAELIHRYACIMTYRGLREQNIVSVSQNFWTGWANKPTDVLVNAFRTVSSFSPNFPAYQSSCRKIQLFFELFRHTYLRRYMRLRVFIVQHQPQEHCTVEHGDREAFLAKMVEKEPSSFVFLQYTRMEHHRRFDYLASLLSSELAKRHVGTSNELKQSLCRFSPRRFDFQALHKVFQS